MSATLGGGDATTQPIKTNWFALPLAAWRLFRLFLFILKAIARAYLVWPRLDEKQWNAEAAQLSRQILNLMGIRLTVTGQGRPGAKLVIANHISWLDIIAINSVVPSRFVSKIEVASWPLIGHIVTGAGTLFIVRERRRDAMRVLGLMSKAMREGRTVAVFPEGTTSEGHGVLHFHGNLLQAAIDAEVPIQPVVLRYSDPDHAVSPRAAYVGDTHLLQSLWWVASARGLHVHATIMSPQSTTHADRRALATLLQSQFEEVLESLPR